MNKYFLNLSISLFNNWALDGIRIAQFIKHFYKRKIQLKISKACFEQSFSEHAFSIYFFIKVYTVNLIKLYFKATIFTHRTL